MNNKRNHLMYAIGTLALGAALVLTGPVGVWATDPPDPATQPHLKSWSNIIPVAKRFVVLADFNHAAVLDRETGLVWEKTPDVNLYQWSTGLAAAHCANDTVVGGRKSWRLPSVVELASLLDPNAASTSFLPAGHPFAPVQATAGYWSAATFAVNIDPPSAWVVSFFGNGGGGVGFFAKADFNHVWCVRGGMNADAY